ncbi:MAG: hypothetical protein QM486_12250 [Flavobacteriaceae bacterium]
MKKLFLLGFIFIGFQFISAQEALNNYKYIIVPKYFEFQDKADSYQINSLTQFLLNKKGLNTLFDDTIYPDDLKHDRCLSLKVNLLMTSNFSRIKIKVTFLNCDNENVYTTEEGVSKEKDYKKAYHEALRGALKSLDGYVYTYTPKTVLTVVKSKPAIKTLTKPKVVVKKVIPKKVVLVEPQNKVKKPKPLKKKRGIKKVQFKEAKFTKKAKIESPLVGLYSNNAITFEIANFKNYYIFSKHIKKGNTFQSFPLGFIFNTSKKDYFLVKISGTFTGYQKNNGDFVIDIIDDEGVLKTVTYKKQ